MKCSARWASITRPPESDVITDFDDYLIHQAALPINQMGIPNRNAYDRYWFNGHDKSGTFLFEAGFGRYPNRFVQDAHFSVSIDGVQHSFHASTAHRQTTRSIRARSARFESRSCSPMRVIRMVIEPNETAGRVRTSPSMRRPRRFRSRRTTCGTGLASSWTRSVSLSTARGRGTSRSKADGSTSAAKRGDRQSRQVVGHAAGRRVRRRRARAG